MPHPHHCPHPPQVSLIKRKWRCVWNLDHWFSGIRAMKDTKDIDHLELVKAIKCRSCWNVLFCKIITLVLFMRYYWDASQALVGQVFDQNVCRAGQWKQPQNRDCPGQHPDATMPHRFKLIWHKFEGCGTNLGVKWGTQAVLGCIQHISM